MAKDFAAQVTGVGALAEPARRALYLYVVAQPAPVSREQAAEGTGAALHTAKFHLDRLVDEGLLEAEFRRLTGRTGPGAGRPAKLYRRSERQVTVSLPERRYDLAGEVLARAVDDSVRRAVPVQDAVRDAAAHEGRQIAAQAAESSSSSSGASGARASDRSTAAQLERTAAVLADHGYEPRTDENQISLANCPFDSLAREHTELVCGMNLALIGGVLDGLGCTRLEPTLDPQPDMCCVRTRVRR